MNSKQTSFLVFVFVLASLSCNLIYGQPKKEQPPAVSEQRTSPTAEPGLSPTQPVSSSEPLVSDSYPIAITTGGTHACVLLSNGKVKCWGSNSEGQLGDGTYTTRNTPAEVPGLENVTAISAGGSHTCALLATGDVKCFGDNYYGQLGDGTMDKH